LHFFSHLTFVYIRNEKRSSQKTYKNNAVFSNSAWDVAAEDIADMVTYTF
jgi:hypothetical protein